LYIDYADIIFAFCGVLATIFLNKNLLITTGSLLLQGLPQEENVCNEVIKNCVNKILFIDGILDIE